MIVAPQFEIGDRVAIHLAEGGDANPFLGTVVAFLDLPGWAYRNYVVELETEMDPLLEVRTGFALSIWGS